MTSSILNPVHQHPSETTDVFGFWIYIMSDCILFATIFATFAVLRNNVFGGVTLKDISNLPYIFIETIVLLTSSFTYGLATIYFYQNKIKTVVLWLVITFLLGFTFITLEINEFIKLCFAGHSWQTSAALSAFFTLVGTHGLHVLIGLVWMFVLIIQLCMPMSAFIMKKRLVYLGLFWAFLDIVWIFVFTIVYLMGAI